MSSRFQVVSFDPPVRRDQTVPNSSDNANILFTLSAMGFKNEKKNKEYLEKTDGNLNEAVKLLVQEKLQSVSQLPVAITPGTQVVVQHPFVPLEKESTDGTMLLRVMKGRYVHN
jgi:hypothetical protein